MDVPIDNERSVNDCLSLLEYRFTIPIFCTEYLILYAYSDYKGIAKDAIDIIDYKKVSSAKTFERFCKSALAHYPCLVPKVKPKLDFYISTCDCLCSRAIKIKDVNVKINRYVNTLKYLMRNFNFKNI